MEQGLERANRLGGLDHFVGRTTEIAWLANAIHAASRGHRQVALLSGEGGIGKTALASTAAAAAEPLGFLAVWGRCWEAGDAPAFWPWVRVLQSCLDIVGDDECKQLLMAACAFDTLPMALRDLSCFARESDGGGATKSDFNEYSQLRLFNAVAKIVKRACEAQPMVIIFDDVHSADKSSMLMLLYVLKELQGGSLLLIIAFRSVELGQQLELKSLVSKLARLGDEICLKGLEDEQIRVYHERMTGEAIGDRKLREVSLVSSGNPLFLSQIIRLSTFTDASGLPLKLLDVMQQRLDLLTEPLISELACAALVGREFSSGLVAKACGEPRDSLVARLSTDSAKAVVRPLNRGLSLATDAFLADYEFNHDFFREACVSRLGADEKRRMHLELAVSMEGLSSGYNLAGNSIARHYYWAIPAYDAAEAVEKLIKAARLSNQFHSYEEAEQLCAMALEVIADNRSIDAQWKIKALLYQGRSAMSLGAFERAKQVFEASFDAAVSLGNGEAACQTALAYGSLDDVGQPLPKLGKKLKIALDLLNPKSVTQKALVLARISDCLLNANRQAESVEHARKARAISSKLDNPVIQARVLLHTSRVLHTPDNLQERLDDAVLAVKLAQQAGHERLELIAHEDVVRQAAEAGDRDLLERHLAIERKIASETGHSFGQWMAHANYATSKSMDGDLPASIAMSKAALEYGMPSGTAQSLYFVQKNDIYWLQDRFEKAIPGVQEVCRRMPNYSAGFTGLVWAQSALQENYALVVKSLNRYVENDFSGIARDLMWLGSMRMLAEAAAVTSAESAADAIYSKLLPYKKSYATMFFSTYGGSVARLLGILKHCVGDLSTADKHFQYAIQAELRVRCPVFESFVRMDRAAALIDEGAPSSFAIAEDEINKAASILERIDIPRGAKQLALLRDKLTHSDEIVEPVVSPLSSSWTVELSTKKDIVSLSHGQAQHQLRASKGLAYLSILLGKPNVAVFALELVEIVNGDGADTAIGNPGVVDSHLTLARDIGNAGSRLDAAAVVAYKQRLNDLNSSLLQAEKNNDIAKISEYKTEMEFIAAELLANQGKGCNNRPQLDHNERARSAVTKAIKAAIKKITAVAPQIGRHLSDCISTGRHCEYKPNGMPPVEWTIRVT